MIGFPPTLKKPLKPKTFLPLSKQKLTIFTPLNFWTPQILQVRKIGHEFFYHCRKLIEEAEHFKASGVTVDRPNSMNKYGFLLADMGLNGVIDKMCSKYLFPLSALFFPESKGFLGEKLEQHHTFLVKYKIGEDLDLSTHVDDSEVTLNVCLGKEFSGGTLFFNGIKGTDSENKENFEYEHKLGRAVFHVGKHIRKIILGSFNVFFVDGANKIKEGERINLILWLRNKRNK
jgi:hypothetical protein